jgi:hypothetical protein
MIAPSDIRRVASARPPAAPAPTRKGCHPQSAGRGAGATIVPAGAKRCSCCGKVKPLGCFYADRKYGSCGLASRCKVCKRAAELMREQTESYRLAKLAYLARPEVRTARRESERRRKERHREALAALRRTPRHRLKNGRSKAIVRFRRATDPARRARLLGLIAEYERELDRMDRAEDRLRRWRPFVPTAGEAII